MAAKIENAKRKEHYLIPAHDLIVRDELRGRSRPPEPEQIKSMALSLIEHGQIEPVEARKNDDGKLEVTLGFTRTEAGKLIVTGFEHNGTTIKDEFFRLAVNVVNCDAKEAFIRNVVENCHRNATSPIDDAYNQQRLREQGMLDVDIAKLYRYASQASVTRLKKLLELSVEEQTLVHEGKLTMSAAIELLAQSTEDRAATIAKITGGEKVTASDIKAVNREKYLDDHADDTTDTSGPATVESVSAAKPIEGKQRSIREIKQFFERIRQTEEDDTVKAFASVVVEFINGRKSDRQMKNAIKKTFEN